MPVAFGSLVEEARRVLRLAASVELLHGDAQLHDGRVALEHVHGARAQPATRIDHEAWEFPESRSARGTDAEAGGQPRARVYLRHQTVHALRRLHPVPRGA